MSRAAQAVIPESCSPVPIPAGYNYLAAFLTLRCNLRCAYCINRFGGLYGRPELSAGEWLAGLNRLQTRPDLPLTLQGGEPTLHPGFYEIVNGLRPEIPIDLLTNLQFDIETFMARVDPARLRRDAPYASIRVSYHPDTMSLETIKSKTLRLLAAGYSVGIWAVAHPAHLAKIEAARTNCIDAGIDFRCKEFLGRHGGVLYGTYSYPGAVDGATLCRVECRTSELLVGPDGGLYRCHSDLYCGRGAYGHLLSHDLLIEDRFRPCERFGDCNPCDVKTKTNRFQQDGHTSVTIRFQK